MVDDFEKLAKKIGMSVVELSLAWVNSRKFVHSNII
jgi:aryl-alcohol dehydrogenase-like predicted oxidoreductase